MDLPHSKVADGIVIEVKVDPRSSKNEIAGVVNNVVRIKLTAPPVDGEANAMLIKFLADMFDVKRSDVVIMKGESSRHKLIKLKRVKP
ncbi:MAG TPA: DUF167 domain-containing protein [Dissulfurispiraceae bacterium]|nr:DUF167 domain-containing protein [Dissulfurispiraceae bacterium]